MAYQCDRCNHWTADSNMHECVYNELEALREERDALRAELRRVKDAKAEELKIADVIEENAQLRAALVEAAQNIDWDQQDASRYYIGEDGAETILATLGFNWELGISNESVEKTIK